LTLNILRVIDLMCDVIN